MAGSINVKDSISDVLSSLDMAGASVAGKLGGIGGLGFKLLGILFVIMFLYNVILFMLEGNGRIMVDITKLTIKWVILASMLAAWTSPASTGVMRDVSVAGFFTKVIPDLANSFTPGGVDPTPEIVDKHVAAFWNVFRILDMKSALNTPNLNMPNYSTITGSPVNKVTVDGVSMENIRASWKTMSTFLGETFDTGYKNLTEIGSALNPVTIIKETLESFVSLLIICLTSFFILWSLLTFVFVLNAGQIILYVGLAVGPILIPFLLIESLSFLFNGWLRLMISAALYKVIAVIIGVIVLGTIDYIVLYSQTVNAGTDSPIFLSLMVLFYAMLGKQLIGLSDNIASSLASGGASSGGDGGSTTILSRAGRGGAQGAKDAKDKFREMREERAKLKAAGTK